MSEFEHLRHKPLSPLERPREILVACPVLRSNINLSRVVRLASCCGVTRMIVCGSAKIDPKIARDGAEQVFIERRNSLPPVLKKYKAEGYTLVGLEQTTSSQNLHHFSYERKTILVLGHERTGLTDDVLSLLDATVEIPVWGLPFSYNVATAAAMALYEYCRQFPTG
ncbi:TrmH family RNA methyltransferase [Lignipirellula cremea]|uniref:tRNA (Guanosine(18)-2'-O)-methyltransferase n=1 Tax=Lignipirellula cremea TaxID=2528010 RepID=A0A518DV97_9BACT|nr:RNA methyltransferase [Lignipirellula cremea]QDU95766.1 tRNA (guanosine(18)-2'-O)-methyltransferase [Lignipirellula cremea]